MGLTASLSFNDLNGKVSFSEGQTCRMRRALRMGSENRGAFALAHLREEAAQPCPRARCEASCCPLTLRPAPTSASTSVAQSPEQRLWHSSWGRRVAQTLYILYMPQFMS
jgi:hypothetical protein